MDRFVDEDAESGRFRARYFHYWLHSEETVDLGTFEDLDDARVACREARLQWIKDHSGYPPSHSVDGPRPVDYWEVEDAALRARFVLHPIDWGTEYLFEGNECAAFIHRSPRGWFHAYWMVTGDPEKIIESVEERSQRRGSLLRTKYRFPERTRILLEPRFGRLLNTLQRKGGLKPTVILDVRDFRGGWGRYHGPVDTSVRNTWIGAQISSWGFSFRWPLRAPLRQRPRGWVRREETILGLLDAVLPRSYRAPGAAQ